MSSPMVKAIRMIDHYAANRNNAHLLEFKVGRGRVLATTLNLLPNLARYLEARYLLHCLADYAHSRAFNPESAVPRDEFLRLFSQRSFQNLVIASTIQVPVACMNNVMSLLLQPFGKARRQRHGARS